MFSLVKKLPTLVNIVKSNNLLISNILKMSSNHAFETLSVTVPKEYVYHVELNRPDKLNAFNDQLWSDLSGCFERLHTDENCRVIILSGAGRLFTAGIDFKSLMKLAPELAAQDDVARKAKILSQYLKRYQGSITSLELCQKPIISAVHNACIGAGINLVTAADIRYCTKDSWFQVKEVALGMAADVGVLQRLPKVVGNDSLVRELCYTARKLPASEALNAGLVSRVFDNKENMIEETIKIAEEIAKHSPVAVQGTKRSLVYSRDHSVQEGLDHIAVWNQMMLQSEDFATATMSQISKDSDVKFSKL